jgi:hypothetical protein
MLGDCFQICQESVMSYRKCKEISNHRCISRAYPVIALPVLAVVFFMSPGALQAQVSDPVMVDVSECIRITSAVGRFACYEEKAGEVMRAGMPPEDNTQTPVRQAPPVVEAAGNPEPQQAVGGNDDDAQPAPQETVSNQAESFGDRPPAASVGRIIRNGDGEDELIDTIAELVEREPNRWLITLAGGQVWYQANSKRFRLREGMQVRIYPSPLGGSYRLSAQEKNGFIQVSKVR